MRSRVPAKVLPLCLTTLMACMTWVREPVPAPPAPSRTIPGHVRITLVDRRTIDLDHVVISTDSLFGRSPDEAVLRYAFPLSDVATMSEEVKSPVRTLLLAGAIIGIVIFSLGGLGG